MANISLGKLKTMLPFTSSPDGRRAGKSKGFLGSLDPEVCFQMTLVPNQSGRRESAGGDKSSSAAGATVPELHVKILSARHLPNIFGLKTVQGYVVKIKLFPGTLRFDSSIQTASWPTFNETFKFPMEPTTKSSFKSKVKHSSNDPEPAHHKHISLPERLFKGHFLVLTVFALLELPTGSGNSIKERLQQMRRRSSILRGGRDKQPDDPAATSGASDDSTPTKDIMQLTCSEQRRNIGSVTCFLDPRMFEENVRTGAFGTEEMWLQLKDITTTAASPARLPNVPIASHPKGQVEIVLQICDLDVAASDAAGQPPPVTPQKRSSMAEQPKVSTPNSATNRWSLGDMRRRLSISGGGGGGGSSKQPKQGLCLRITTAKMRCSIKCKEQFENMDNGCAMYIKTAVYRHDILANAWKSDQFAPSLSVRWNPDHSELRVPLAGADDLQHIAVRTTIATKTKLGKKIVLGTLILGGGRTAPGTPATEHWASVAESAGNAVAVWHAFE